MIDPTTSAVVTIAGEDLMLLPERAIYWPRMNTLLIADLHLGKEATFRTAGIAVPDGTRDADLTRLDRALAHTGAAHLIILGDLLHAAHGRTADVLDTLSRWRAIHEWLTIDLVRGNHDRSAGDPPPSWGMVIRDTGSIMKPFVLQHHPTASTNGYVLAGHLHPAVTLTGVGKQRLTLPCYWFGAQIGTLPAFGSFTGNALIRPETTDQVFAVTPETVLRVG